VVCLLFPSIEIWRNQGHGQLWSAVLPISLAIIGLVLVFLVTTGSEALNLSLSLMASLAAAVPALAFFLGYFKSRS